MFGSPGDVDQFGVSKVEKAIGCSILKMIQDVVMLSRRN